MQEPTHILAGVVIQKALEWKKHPRVAMGLTAVLAFLSHGFLDNLADITYHPANADFRSPFWVCYHSVILIATILFLYLWWRRFKWGIFFAMLPDLDWVFIHGQEIFHIAHPIYQRPYMHEFLGYIYRQTPLMEFFRRLPNNRHNPLGCLWELLLVTGLLLLIRYQCRPTPAAPIPHGETRTEEQKS